MNYSKKGVRAKKKALNSKSQKIGRKAGLLVLKLCLICFMGLGVVGASAGIGMYKGILASTPQITPNDVAPIGAATFVYDCEGNKLDELIAVNSNRIIVTQDKIPENLAHAFVALEDERFYQHNGIDYKAMLRSGYQFVKTLGDETQGASTITQQLLKNTIFTSWTSEGDNLIKKIKRKLQEQYLAIELTKTLSKDEVLVRYMNTINLGHPGGRGGGPAVFWQILQRTDPVGMRGNRCHYPESIPLQSHPSSRGKRQAPGNMPEQHAAAGFYQQGRV